MNGIPIRVPWMLTVIALAGSVTGTTVARESVVVEVKAGDHERHRIPIVFPLPAQLADAKTIWLQQLDSGEQRPVQRTTTGPPRAVWMLHDRLPAHQARSYRISASRFDRDRKTAVTCTDDGQSVTVHVRGKAVLRYHTAVVFPPDGLDAVYRRSGFIHPLQTPGGRVLTAAFPADHPHQHGIFNAWVKTEFDGRPVNFWDQAGGTGTVEHVEVTSVASGPVFGEFSVRLKHVDLSAEPEPVTVLDETWTVRVYDRTDIFLIDLESEQRCATELPLIVQEYRYGGMAIRGTAAWLDPAGSDFLTSEGKSRADGNHSRPNWTDLFGVLQGHPCGVAVLQHPGNLRFPAPVRLHPSKPYFVYAPAVLGDLTIEPEQPLTSRYRYVVHDGRPDADLLNTAWTDYAEPPTVRIIE